MKLLKRLLGNWYNNSTIRLLAEIVLVILPLAFAIRTFVFGFYQVPTGSMETTLLVGERFFADKFTYWFRKPARYEIIAFDEPRYAYSQNPIIDLWQRYVSWNVTNWTKRIIGVPGDHIKGVIEEGKPVVYINGKKLDESAYVNSYPLINLWKQDPNKVISVPGIDTYESTMRKLQENMVWRSYDPEKPFSQQPFYTINPDMVVRQQDGSIAEQWPYTPIDRDEYEHVLAQNQYWVMGDNRLYSHDSRFFGPLDAKFIHGRIVFRVWSMDSDYSWLLLDLLFNPIGFWQKVRWSRCFEWVT